MKRIAPIFPVRNLAASISHSRLLGFTVREYDGVYGLANRDDVEIHLGTPADPNSASANHSAYLWVDDSDALAQEWQAVGAEVHMPEDTDWGQHEGAMVDTDCNIIRFGSPIG
jgi:hypothetical protein